MHTCAGPSATRVHIYTQVDTHGWMHCSTHVSAFIPSCGAHTPTHTFTGMHLLCTTMHHRPYCMCVKHPQGCTAGVSTCPHTCTRTPTQCVHTAGCSHALIDAHTPTHAPLLHVHTHAVAVQSPGHVRFFMSPWTAARQASLSFTISQSLLKLVSFESVIPSNHLILCRPLILPSIFPSFGVVSNE